MDLVGGGDGDAAAAGFHRGGEGRLVAGQLDGAAGGGTARDGGHTAYSHRVDPEAVLPRRSLKRIVRMQPKTIDDVAELVDAVFAQRHGATIVEMVSRCVTR